MLNSFDLAMLKNVAVTECSIDNLVDLRNVNIDVKKSVPEKINDYFLQIKNPYIFKIGDIKVKINFNENRTFAETLSTVILNENNRKITTSLY